MQLSDAEDNRVGNAHGEFPGRLVQSKTPRTRRRSLYGTWETSATPGVASLGRARKGNAAIVPCTVLRSRTTSYYRGSSRTTATHRWRSEWREGR